MLIHELWHKHCIHVMCELLFPKSQGLTMLRWKKWTRNLMTVPFLFENEGDRKKPFTYYHVGCFQSGGLGKVYVVIMENLSIRTFGKLVFRCHMLGREVINIAT